MEVWASAAPSKTTGPKTRTTEKWWIHNWSSTVVFPPMDSGGWISYNFAVDNTTAIYSAPANSGNVMVFVTIGTTSDVNQPISNWGTVGWPTNVTLPQNFFYPEGASQCPGRYPSQRDSRPRSA